MTGMVDYVVAAPNGKKYPIKGPPGATPEQQLAAVLRRVPDAAQPAGPPPDEAGTMGGGDITRTNSAPAMDPHAPASSGVPADQLHFKDDGENPVGRAAAIIPGALDAGASMLSGVGGEMLGGLGYLMKAPIYGDAAGQAAKKDIQDTVTWQPHTDTGKNLLTMASSPFDTAGKLGVYAGEKLADAGHPLLGAAVTTAAKGAPWALGARGAIEHGIDAVRGPRAAPAQPMPPAPATPSMGAEPLQGPTPQGPIATPAIPGKGTTTGTMRAILAKLEADGVSVDELRQRLEDAAKVGKPQSIAAVANPRGNVQGLARSMNTIPGPNRNIAVASTDAAVTGMPDRVAANVDEMAGQRGVDTEQLQDSIDAAKKAAMGPAYEEAFAEPIENTPELLARLTNNPAYERSHNLMRENQRTSGDYGTAATELFDKKGGIARTVDVRDLDMIKKGLDAHVRDAGGGLKMDVADQTKKESIGNYEGARASLMAIVNKLHPKYLKARQSFGDATEISNALEDGRDLLTKGEKASPQEVRRQMALLSDAGKKAFKAGVADALRRRVYSKADTSPAGTANALVGSGEGSMMQMIRAVFGDGVETQRALAQMKAEQARQSLRNEVQGGSKTADKAMDVADHVADHVEAASHGMTAAVVHGVAKGFNAIRGKIDTAHRTSVSEELFKTRSNLEGDKFFKAMEEAARKRAERGGDTGGVH